MRYVLPYLLTWFASLLQAERRLSGRLAGKRRVLGEKNGNTSKQDLISNASIQVVHSSKSSTTRDETLVACTSYNEFAVS